MGPLRRAWVWYWRRAISAGATANPQAVRWIKGLRWAAPPIAVIFFLNAALEDRGFGHAAANFAVGLILAVSSVAVWVMAWAHANRHRVAIVEAPRLTGAHFAIVGLMIPVASLLLTLVKENAPAVLRALGLG